MNAISNKGEQIIREGKANYFGSGERIYLTNQRILFEGHGFNIGQASAVINLIDVVNCRTNFPTSPKVLTNDNKEHVFAVSNKGGWCNEILKITSNLKNGI